MNFDVNLNTIILFIIGLINLYVATIAKKTEKNVQIIETATNSMKDALVEATAKASLAEGTAAGLQQGRHEAKVEEPVKVEITNIPKELKP